MPGGALPLADGWTSVRDMPVPGGRSFHSLWAERRSIVRVTVPLAGRRRRALYAGARALETGSALLRRLITPRESEK